MAKKIVKRCISAVAATAAVQQQITKKTAPSECAVKTKTSGYRKSMVSSTIRVPNELAGKVRELITSYRKEQQNNPDTW
jgi:hypothetical protein